MISKCLGGFKRYVHYFSDYSAFNGSVWADYIFIRSLLQYELKIKIIINALNVYYVLSEYIQKVINT